MFREALAQFAPRAMRGASAALAAAIIVIFSVSSAASAGLFDFLFNPAAPIWNPFAPEPHQAQPIERTGSVRRKKPPVSAAHVRRLETTKPSAFPLASRDFMDDQSLRGGDAVMTPNGIRIFTGPPGDRHRPDQFSSLDAIKGLGKRERSALSALDTPRPSAMRSAEAEPSILMGRSAAEPGPSGTLVTDSKGRPIRYVGP
jgi:hypothetical protein